MNAQHELLKKQLLALDHKSDDFAELFHVVNEKYMTFENPDRYQQAAMTLNLILHRESPELEMLVESLAQIANMIFEVQAGAEAMTMNFEFKKKMMNIDIYTSEKAKAALQKIFTNTVVMKAKEQGIEINKG